MNINTKHKKTSNRLKIIGKKLTVINCFKYSLLCFTREPKRLSLKLYKILKLVNMNPKIIPNMLPKYENISREFSLSKTKLIIDLETGS
jgi:hypothetical protein